MYCEDPDIIRRTAKMGLYVASIIIVGLLIRFIL